MATAQDVFLDTEDRINQSFTSPQDCVVPVRMNQSGGSSRPFPGGYTVQLMDVHVKWTWFGIDSTNNVFVMGDASGGAAEVFTIPPGIYSFDTLATTIQNILNEAEFLTVTTWLVNFLQPQQRFEIDSDVIPTNFTMLAGHPSFTAFEALGSTEGQTYTSFAGTLVTGNIIDTVHIDYAYVWVDWPGVGAVVSAAKNGDGQPIEGVLPIVTRVHTPATWGDRCLFGGTDSRWISNRIPEQVSMRLYDHQWNLVDTQGVNWSVHLKLYDLPGGAKSLNHVTEVRHQDQILSNATMPDDGVSNNIPSHPRTRASKDWDQMRRPPPAVQGPGQRQKTNHLTYPNADSGF